MWHHSCVWQPTRTLSSGMGMLTGSETGVCEMGPGVGEHKQAACLRGTDRLCQEGFASE